MDFSKLRNKIYIIFLLFVFLFPFFCITGFCTETEDVEFEVVSNLAMFSSSNYFQANSGYSVGYIELDNNYIYHITFNTDHAIAYSDNIPAVNIPYYDYSVINSGTTLDLYPTHQYIYFDFSRTTDVTITRTPLTSMNSAVNSLVDNVGVNNLWNIFDSSINYIVIVVLFAFGCFLIFTIIRKISKGKGDV